MSQFTVIYDACVLYPAPIRDLLIQLATTGLFRAKWSADIHEEWISAVLRDRSDLNREQLERTRALMDKAVPDCLVENYVPLINAIKLRDPNDRHVLAAAIKCSASAIITKNKRDFDQIEPDKYEIEAIHPDDFISYQADLDNSKFVISAFECRRRLCNPRKSFEEYIDSIRKNGLLEPDSKVHVT